MNKIIQSLKRIEQFFFRKEKKVVFHVSSSLKNTSINRDLCVMYEESSKMGSYCAIKCCTVVTSVTVSHLFYLYDFLQMFRFKVALCMGQKTQIENERIVVNNWLQFTTSNEDFSVFCRILEKIILSRITSPEKKGEYYENAAIETLHTILSAEDSVKDLIQPHGIGARPRILHRTTKDSKTTVRFSRAHEQESHCDQRFKKNCVREYNRNQQGPSSSNTNKPRNFFLIKPTIDDLKFNLAQNQWLVPRNLQNAVSRYLNVSSLLFLIFRI